MNVPQPRVMSERDNDMRANLSAVVAELDSRGLLPEDHLAVLCVGSVARGWANEKSDYDIYVVTGEYWANHQSRALPVSLRPHTVPTVSLEVAGRRWELKYWQDDQVDQMLAKVSWDSYEEGASSVKFLSDVEELCLERLLSCVPLAGTEWVDRRRRQLDESAFRAFVTTRSLAGLDSATEDVLGQLASDDTHSAVLSARRAVGHVIDALLESKGCYGSGQPKWRSRRFRDTAPPELSYDDYWALETMRGLDPEKPAQWARTVLETCNRLAMDVEI